MQPSGLDPVSCMLVWLMSDCYRPFYLIQVKMLVWAESKSRHRQNFLWILIYSYIIAKKLDWHLQALSGNQLLHTHVTCLTLLNLSPHTSSRFGGPFRPPLPCVNIFGPSTTPVMHLHSLAWSLKSVVTLRYLHVNILYLLRVMRLNPRLTAVCSDAVRSNSIMLESWSNWTLV